MLKLLFMWVVGVIGVATGAWWYKTSYGRTLQSVLVAVCACIIAVAVLDGAGIRPS
jgi:uncharacterized membrane protein YfcA